MKNLILNIIKIKQALLLAAMFVLFLSPFCAQAQMFKNLSIGPYFAFKAGVNVGNVQDGRKNGLALTGVPDFGVSSKVILSDTRDLGITFDLGYSSYAYKIKNADNSDSYTMKYGYINLNPNLYFSGLLLGLNFGIPVNANYGPSISTSKIGFMTEFRLGGIVPLYSDNESSLNFIVNAGYMLTGIYGDYPNDDPLKTIIKPVPPQKITDKFNPRALSLSIGINYLFNLNPVTEEQ
jgi:hypothetical protein